MFYIYCLSRNNYHYSRNALLIFETSPWRLVGRHNGRADRHTVNCVATELINK